MLMSILGLLGGGLMRLLPELFNLFGKAQDNTHELALMDKQIALEQAKANAQVQTIQAQGEANLSVADMQALSEALTAQMKVTGMRLVDALNFLVRPMTTYYFLFLYGAAKVAMFVLAYQHGISGWEAILKLYDDEDRAILSGTLSFWFVGRVFEKAKQ